jgi:hypothetical protein
MNDQDKVELLALVAARAAAYSQDGREDLRRLLKAAVRDCLQLLLGRQPTGSEVWRVVTGEAPPEPRPERGTP